MLGLKTRIGSISIIELRDFPGSAKKGDKVNGIVGVGNNLQWDSMQINTIVKTIVGGESTEIFNYTSLVPPKTQYNYAVSFTMLGKDVKVQAENYWLEPETGDYILEATSSINVKLGNGGDGEEPPFDWKYAAIGGGIIAVIAMVMAVSRK